MTHHRKRAIVSSVQPVRAFFLTVFFFFFASLLVKAFSFACIFAFFLLSEIFKTCLRPHLYNPILPRSEFFCCCFLFRLTSEYFSEELERIPVLMPVCLCERQKASCLHVVRMSHFLVRSSVFSFFISILEYITPYSHPHGITQNKSGWFPNMT